jgi:hypothetical protein
MWPGNLAAMERYQRGWHQLWRQALAAGGSMAKSKMAGAGEFIGGIVAAAAISDNRQLAGIASGIAGESWRKRQQCGESSVIAHGESLHLAAIGWRPSAMAYQLAIRQWPAWRINGGSGIAIIFIGWRKQLASAPQALSGGGEKRHHRRRSISAMLASAVAAAAAAGGIERKSASARWRNHQ